MSQDASSSRWGGYPDTHCNTLLKKSKEKRISSRRNKRKLNKKFSK
jgi:hypothetical protein